MTQAPEESTDDFSEWAKAEFEQSYVQIRDRDQRAIELTKFYATLLCSIGAVCATVLGIPNVQPPLTWVGALLLATGVVGVLVLVWLVGLRRYFVKAARQLNAVRAFLTRHASAETMAAFVVHSTDREHPPYWHGRSTYVAMLVLVAFINSCLCTAGCAAIVIELKVTGWPVYAWGSVAFAAPAIVSVVCFRRRLGGR